MYEKSCSKLRNEIDLVKLIKMVRVTKLFLKGYPDEWALNKQDVLKTSKFLVSENLKMTKKKQK